MIRSVTFNGEEASLVILALEELAVRIPKEDLNDAFFRRRRAMAFDLAMRVRLA